jgi:hypothetical protein
LDDYQRAGIVGTNRASSPRQGSHANGMQNDRGSFAWFSGIEKTLAESRTDMRWEDN